MGKACKFSLSWAFSRASSASTVYAIEKGRRREKNRCTDRKKSVVVVGETGEL